MRYITIIIFALTCLFAAECQAQSCYGDNRSRGIALYEAGQYEDAIGVFTAAKDCPDCPANNDLDAQISKCRQAIAKAEEDRKREEERKRAELERQRREEQERQRRLNEAKQKGYMDIGRLEFGNTDRENNMLNNYGSVLYASDIKYLKPKISYTGLASQKISLYVKIYRPDGTLMSGKGSPEGYTFYDDVAVETGNNTLFLSGWGNADGGAYTTGAYKYEIWYDRRMLYNTTITLFKKAGEASRLTVDGKEAVTSTFNGNGGKETFYISTDADSYETWGVPTWCSIEDRSSSSFTLVCEPNTGAERSDYMEIRAGGKSVRIDISQAARTRGGKIESVNVDHNQWVGGQKGMLVHIKFTVDGMKGRKGRCALYFSFGDGSKLKDYNNSYCTVDGQVSAGATFTPGYESALYEDFKVFMPYTELHMQSGQKNVSMRFYVLLYDEVTEVDLAKSDYTYFTFSN